MKKCLVLVGISGGGQDKFLENFGGIKALLVSVLSFVLSMTANKIGPAIQKIVQDKEIILSIYVLSGLLLGCLIATIFGSNQSTSMFLLSIGMLVGTVIYMIVPKAKKKRRPKEQGKLLILLTLLGIILGGFFGFVCYKLIGMYLGIGIGMILGIAYYLKKISKKQK